jgi:hypothetical protein
MAVSLTSSLHRNDEFVHSAIDNETVMMSIEQGEYYGLDDIATRIWNILDEPHSVNQICDLLQPDYDVDRQQMEQDVLAFLDEMVKGKILYSD